MDNEQQLEKILSDYKNRLSQLNNSNSYENFSEKLKAELRGKDKAQAENLFLERLKNFSLKLSTKIGELQQDG